MKSIQKTLIVLGAMAIVTALTPHRASAQRSGVEVWAQTCGNCHVAQPGARYSAENWQRLIRHMMITARMTDDDAAAVQQFLIGSARRVASNASGNDETAQVTSGALETTAPLVTTPAGVTAGRRGVSADLTAEEAKALQAYVRTMIWR